MWTIGNGEVALSSHVVACRGAEASSLLAQMNRLLQERFEIVHVTIQVEPEVSDDVRSLSESDAVCSGGCSAARLAAGSG